MDRGVDVDMHMDMDMDMDVKTTWTWNLEMDMDTDTDTIYLTSIRTEVNRNSICFGSVSVFFAKLLCNGQWPFFFFFGLFRMVFGCFGYIETPKQAVLILKRNTRNKRPISDSNETSFGYIETKLVS
jgi:hypothetical protein